MEDDGDGVCWAASLHLKLMMGPGELARWLRGLATLSEDLDSVSSIHRVTYYPLNLQSQESDALL